VNFLLVLSLAVVGLFLLVYFLQEKFIFLPSRLPDDYQFSFDAPFKEYLFNPEKGVSINALLFTSDQRKGLILYFHGNAGDLSDWGHVSTDFTGVGYDILLIDYRGYGKSRGNISEAALYRDAAFIYDQMTENYSESEIVVYGRSIGTGIASQLAVKRSPRLLILESPYYNLKDLARQVMPFVPAFLLRYHFPNHMYLPKVQCPIVLIHGSHDELIDHRASIRLKALVQTKGQIYIIDGGHHNDLATMDAYHEVLSRVL